MIRKFMKTITLAAVVATALSATSFAGQWLLHGSNWYYQQDDGSNAKNQWVGNYYLGSDGVMYTNSWTPDGYYVDASGKWDGRPSASTGYTQEPVNAIGQYIFNSPLVEDMINTYEMTWSYGGTPVQIIQSNDTAFYDMGTYYEIPNCDVLGAYYDEYGEHGYYTLVTGPMYVRKNAMVYKYDYNTGATIPMTAQQIVQQYGSLYEGGYISLCTIGCATSFDSNGYITELSVHAFE